MPIKRKVKELTIIVNGTAHAVKEKILTFMEIVTLGFGAACAGTNTTFTVAYRKGQGNKEGTVDPDGGSIRIKEGMIFNVTKTDKS